ncbi:cell division suppressor protein YneA [Aneurinibacillus terranovensis]|uniref:cell division suppressor protein YneA n=1 Tax=Aneurinibacillus terranovensis TaxID=278991 RepID=UPI000425143B|nr:LysM peptidoglycan-binding domain-containing protein [Aneurinibacillus terranovensis]
MNKKLLFTGLIFILCILGMTKIVFAAMKGGSNDTSITVTVQEGETLWNIADRYNEQEGMSVPELIFYIKQANHLKTAMIQPGDKIIIPRK